MAARSISTCTSSVPMANPGEPGRSLKTAGNVSKPTTRPTRRKRDLSPRFPSRGKSASSRFASNKAADSLCATRLQRYATSGIVGETQVSDIRYQPGRAHPALIATALMPKFQYTLLVEESTTLLYMYMIWIKRIYEPSAYSPLPRSQPPCNVEIKTTSSPSSNW